MAIGLLIGFWPKLTDNPQLPDFTTYQDSQAKKSAFFSFMLSLASKQNDYILQQREQLLVLEGKSFLNPAELKWLRLMSMFYRLDAEEKQPHQWIKTLFKRVDIIPVSLVLSQSANESAWGTSRFAVEGNNLFGQWCYSRGCGMVPNQRAAKASHEVASYNSPMNSVSSYIHNLNTNNAYRHLRELRWQQRQADQLPTGLVLASGLTHYSSRGEAYVEELQNMIRFNRLAEYDMQALTSVDK
jgi:Bax protein